MARLRNWWTNLGLTNQIAVISIVVASVLAIVLCTVTATVQILTAWWTPQPLKAPATEPGTPVEREDSDVIHPGDTKSFFGGRVRISLQATQPHPDPESYVVFATVWAPGHEAQQIDGEPVGYWMTYQAGTTFRVHVTAANHEIAAFSVFPVPALSPTPVLTPIPLTPVPHTPVPSPTHVPPTHTPIPLTPIPLTPVPHTPVPSPTHVPPTHTPIPSHDFRYLQGSLRQFPNCGVVHLRGKVIGVGGEPVNGTTVRLRFGGKAAYNVSGEGGSAGEWGFAPLDPAMFHTPTLFTIDIVRSESDPLQLSDAVLIQFLDCALSGQFDNIVFAYVR